MCWAGDILLAWWLSGSYRSMKFIFTPRLIICKLLLSLLFTNIQKPVSVSCITLYITLYNSGSQPTFNGHLYNWCLFMRLSYWVWFRVKLWIKSNHFHARTLKVFQTDACVQPLFWSWKQEPRLWDSELNPLPSSSCLTDAVNLYSSPTVSTTWTRCHLAQDFNPRLQRCV